MLLNKTYSLGTSTLLTKAFLNFYIEKFFNEIFKTSTKESHLLLMVKVQLVDDSLGWSKKS